MTLVSHLCGAVLIALGFATPAFAQQDYPNRPITWIVPFSPGGNTDNAARLTAKGLSERLGQPVIIENKPGAGGIVGAEYVANAKPDGYTFLYASSGPMSTIPATRKTMSYDPVTSFTPLHGMVSSSLVMVIAPTSRSRRSPSSSSTPGKIRATELFVDRHRRVPTSDRRTVRHGDQDRHRPHPLQGDAAGTGRHHLRDHRFLLGLFGGAETLDRCRQVARAGGQRTCAPVEPARRADTGRARLSGRRVHIVGHGGDADSKASAQTSSRR
jgi:hypothetical protein